MDKSYLGLESTEWLVVNFVLDAIFGLLGFLGINIGIGGDYHYVAE